MTVAMITSTTTASTTSSSSSSSATTANVPVLPWVVQNVPPKQIERAQLVQFIVENADPTVRKIRDFSTTTTQSNDF
jgi:hypothetical protein